MWRISRHSEAEKGYARCPAKSTQPAAGTVDKQFIDMSRSPQIHPRCTRRALLSHPATVLLVLSSVVVIGCGALDCPEPLIAVEGTCHNADPVTREEPEPGVEPCDGVDNDGDNEVDEDWPELGEPCGERAGVGECVEGEYVCADDGTGVVCEGAVGPSDEVCDGKDNDCDGTKDNGPEETCDGEDNDCDGLVDEGVLSLKQEVFSNHATVTAVDGGFVVTRAIGSRLRVETYDTGGNPTGHHDDINSPDPTSKFLQSDGSGGRVLIALGKNSFHVVEADISSNLLPIIVSAQALHAGWNQAESWGIYFPPYHPRVLASPPRFLGHRSIQTFALNSFAGDDLSGLAQEPTAVMDVPAFQVFDVAGLYVMWQQGDNLRAALLLNDGGLSLDIDVARGHAPGISIGRGGPGVVYLQDGGIRLSELGGVTLQCTVGGFCNEAIDTPGSQEAPTGPTALAFDEASDTWFVMAGTQLAVVGRGEDGAIVKQAEVLDAIDNAPNRVDVAVSGGTAAIVQAAAGGESALTFLGCF